MIRLLTALLLLAAAMAPLGAARADDGTDIRAVIEDQLAAFGRDDGARAFAHAAPIIQEKFGTAETFMSMVRTAYPQVYRPGAREFLPLETIEGITVQKVRLTGADGRSVIAVYPMERQADGEWRIAGCYLLKQPGTDV